MKQKRNCEEYITRQELESTYNYQRKVFNSKIEEINQIIDKIQECFSLRFGEDINNSKYDKEIEELKYNLKQIQVKNIGQLEEIAKGIENTIDGKINEFEFKNQKALEEDRNATKDIIKADIEKFYEEVNSKIIEEEEYKKIKLKELNESIDYIEKQAKQLKENTEEYVNTFREQLKDIATDGRSKTAIGKLQKTIQNIRQDKQEIEELINTNVEELNNALGNLEANLKIDINSKIQNLDYENTIQSLKNSLVNLEGLVALNSNENNKNIRALGQNMQKALEQLDYQNTINNLKCNIIKLQNQRNSDIEENEEKLEEAEIYLQNEIKQNIQNLAYEDTLSRIEYLEDIIEQIRQENEQIEVKNEEMAEQVQALLSIVATLEDKFERSNIETISKDVGQIIDRQLKGIQEKYDKFFAEQLKAFKKNIKGQQIVQNNIPTIATTNTTQNRTTITQRRRRENMIPSPNYNVVTFQNRQNNPSNIYNTVQQNNPTQIKQSAQNNIGYNQKQTYLQEAINKLKTQKEISAQIRNTTPKKNQILFDFDEQ